MSSPAGPIMHVLSGDLWGGSEAQMAVQLAALRELGIDARAVFLNDGEVHHRYRERGIPCVLAEERFGLRRCFRVLRNQVRTLSPSLIVSHGYKENILSGLCSVLAGIPWMPVFHGLGEPFTGWKARKAAVYYRLSEFFARVRACRIVTVSEAMAKSLGFAGDSRLKVIRNVVELPGRESVGVLGGLLPPGSQPVVFAGRLVPIKRVDLLIEAFSRLDGEGAHLVIVGEGPEREKLEALAKQSVSKARIHFLGFRNDAIAIIGEAEVFVICSDSEGIPTVLLEALALQRKIVSTKVGGIPEVMELFSDYPCELVPAGDTQALADALKRLLPRGATVPETWETLERHFSPRVAAEAHAAIYRELFRA